MYVSNKNGGHKDTRILMLDHGKHVLCETPLAVRLPSMQHFAAPLHVCLSSFNAQACVNRDRQGGRYTPSDALMSAHDDVKLRQQLSVNWASRLQSIN